jgi:5-methylthioadenosine/S-adenosylhomocysteine deaminase
VRQLLQDGDVVDRVVPELGDTGFQQRPRQPFEGQLIGPRAAGARPRPSLSKVLGPLELDRLTVADDTDWLDRIEAQANLPVFIKDGLRGLYP